MAIRLADISVTRNGEGALVLSIIHAGYLVTRRYYGYTQRDAMRLFRSELEESRG